MSRYYVEDLQQHAVKKLTQLLAMPPHHLEIVSPKDFLSYPMARPSDQWLAAQEKLMEHLPKSCLRPTSYDPVSIGKRVLMKATEKRPIALLPDAAVLCSTHKHLHPWKIRSLFIVLGTEVSVRSDRIRSFRGSDNVPLADSVSQFVERMNGISALWMSPKFFRRLFDKDTSAKKIESGCEACIMAVVGGRGRLLADLRANMTSRSRRRHEPELLRFVNSWIECFGSNGESIISESEQLSAELKAIRQDITQRRKERRARRRMQGQSVPYSRVREPELSKEGYPLPKPPRHRPTNEMHTKVRQEHGLAGAELQEQHYDPGTDYCGNEAYMSGAQTFYEASENPFMSPEDAKRYDTHNHDEFPEDDDDEGRDELSGIYERYLAHTDVNEEDIHPAFRSASTLVDDFQSVRPGKDVAGDEQSWVSATAHSTAEFARGQSAVGGVSATGNRVRQYRYGDNVYDEEVLDSNLDQIAASEIRARGRLEAYATSSHYSQDDIPPQTSASSAQWIPSSPPSISSKMARLSMQDDLCQADAFETGSQVLRQFDAAGNPFVESKGRRPRPRSGDSRISPKTSMERFNRWKDDNDDVESLAEGTVLPDDSVSCVGDRAVRPRKHKRVEELFRGG